VPDAFSKTPALVQNIFSSAAATAGLTAMLLSVILPELSDQDNQSGS
jgi:xanthine permease XanP